MMLTFGEERLEAALEEVQELWQMHFQETEGYRHELGYNPDVEAFLKYDRGGMFRLYTIRNEEHRLMGQIGFVVYKSRHTQTTTAGEDFWYVRKEARGKGAASRLLGFALGKLSAEGVQQVTVSDKQPVNLEPLLKKFGFAFVSKQYSKLLTGQQQGG